jgi:hypothetical protein
MSREAMALALTFVLASVSATFFLLMRCEGRGRAFGSRSRGWALRLLARNIVLLIDAHAPRSRVVAAVKASRLGREARYQRNLDDLKRFRGRR